MERKFLAEGPRVVREALASPQTAVDHVFLRDDDAIQDIRQRAESRGVEVIEVSDAVIKSLSTTTTPQGCVAVVQIPATDLSALPEKIALGLVLAGISDPGNAGTLLRSATGAGCDCVVFTTTSVDPFGPKTVRASAGAVFRSRIVSGVSLPEVLASVRSRGCRAIGADARAPVTCYEADLKRDVCFVLGNEAHGFDRAEVELDDRVSLPLPGGIESLNVAVAGSVLLFEAVRQRGARNGGLSSPPDD